MVSGTNGSPLVEGPSVGTRAMQDSWMNDELVAGGAPACTNVSLSGSVQSEFHGSLTVQMRCARVGGTTAPFPRLTIIFSRCLESGLAVVLPARSGHDGDGLAFQEGGRATGTEGDEDHGMTFLTGEHCEDISYGTSAWAGGCESTNDTPDPNELAEHNMWNPMLELFCHADMEALADDMVLGILALTCHFALDILCDKSETQECADVATFDLSNDCTDWTSGDQCNVMSAGYKGSVSTWTRALELVSPSFEVSQTVQWFCLQRTVSQAL